MPESSSKNELDAYLQSNEWLKDLFDQAHDLIQMVAIDGSMIYVNKTWSEVLGYEPQQIPGSQLLSFIDEPDRQRYAEYRSQVINGTISHKPIIFKLVTKDGKRISVEGTVGVNTVNGHPLYTRGIFRDITERIENEKRLQSLYDKLAEREYNLQQLLTYAPDAIIVIDVNSNITYWNPKAEEIFGWKAEEVIGRTLSSTIVPEQYRQAHESGLKRYLSTGEARVLNKTIEISALNRSGEEFYVSLTISSASQHSGIAFVAFIRDIHQQKLAQRELENKTKQLELSNRSLEAFAYATSHDLKQPIRKMQLFAGRLAESAYSKLNDMEKDFLSRIENASVRMKGLIDDLLNYSSLSEETELHVDIDLTELFNQVIRDLDMEIREQGTHIEVGPLPVVNGNARQIQQLFHNLIENSIKYSTPSVPNVIQVHSRKTKGSESVFELSGTELDRTFHVIEISDQGIGFDQAHADKLFNMFFRLHTQQQYEGTGVGLAIARKVIENHQGYIRAEGAKGHGATFTIMLPA